MKRSHLPIGKAVGGRDRIAEARRFAFHRSRWFLNSEACCSPAPLRQSDGKYCGGMFRVCQLLIVATLPASITGCTWEPEAQPAIRIVTKTVVKIVEREKPGRVVAQCPRDEEIADGVVVTFADIYPRVPGSTRTCPCPDSTYVHYGKMRSCASAGAIHPAAWAYCSPDAVPATLIAEIKSKIAACQNKPP